MAVVPFSSSFSCSKRVLCLLERQRLVTLRVVVVKLSRQENRMDGEGDGKAVTREALLRFSYHPLHEHLAKFMYELGSSFLLSPLASQSRCQR